MHNRHNSYVVNNMTAKTNSVNHIPPIKPNAKVVAMTIKPLIVRTRRSEGFFARRLFTGFNDNRVPSSWKIKKPWSSQGFCLLKAVFYDLMLP